MFSTSNTQCEKILFQKIYTKKLNNAKEQIRRRDRNQKSLMNDGTRCLVCLISRMGPVTSLASAERKASYFITCGEVNDELNEW